VAYESDLEFVENAIKTITKEELGIEMTHNIERFKELLKETPVDELEIKEFPFTTLRINANTWVEVTITYLVEPKKASATRSNLIRKILKALNQEAGKVMFPNSNNR